MQQDEKEIRELVSTWMSETKAGNVGWTFLGRDYWGGSYNSEIKQLMLTHAFAFAETVVFWVGVHNHRSRRAMEKIGGILREGVRTRSLSGDEPHVVYEIRKPHPATT
jgi:RimJ/RimL family protein N-acetyltransferase